MKQIIAGILACGRPAKTTFVRSTLYSSGSIKKIGRVDNGDAFLDTDAMEKKRGITIFSKRAELQFGDTKMTLLDTLDTWIFSADGADADGVITPCLSSAHLTECEAHTQTLWRLLNGMRSRYFFLSIKWISREPTERQFFWS